MADFPKALFFILGNEGGFTVDHAGPTKFGITLPSLIHAGTNYDLDKDGEITKNDVASLTIRTAAQFYFDQFWKQSPFEEIPNQKLAEKILDIQVNTGAAQGTKLLQKAIVSLHRPVKIDGIFGPKTLKALLSLMADILRDMLKCVIIDFYNELNAKDPKKYGKYLDGWLARADR